MYKLDLSHQVNNLYADCTVSFLSADAGSHKQHRFEDIGSCQHDRTKLSDYSTLAAKSSVKTPIINNYIGETTLQSSVDDENKTSSNEIQIQSKTDSYRTVHMNYFTNSL